MGAKPDLKETAKVIVEKARREQGLPDKVRDPAVISRIVRLLELPKSRT